MINLAGLFDSIPNVLRRIEKKSDDILKTVLGIKPDKKCDDALAAIVALSAKIDQKFGGLENVLQALDAKANEAIADLTQILLDLTPTHRVADSNPTYGIPHKSNRRR